MVPRARESGSRLPPSTPSTSIISKRVGEAFSSKSFIGLVLYHVCAQQVTHIQCTDPFILGVDGGQGVDPGAAHYLRYFCDQHAGADGPAIGVHDILNNCMVQVDLVIDDAAQIAIGKDPDRLAC